MAHNIHIEIIRRSARSSCEPVGTILVQNALSQAVSSRARPRTMGAKVVEEESWLRCSFAIRIGKLSAYTLTEEDREMPAEEQQAARLRFAQEMAANRVAAKLRMGPRQAQC